MADGAMADGARGLALCWRLERGDGAGMALTSHDRAIEVGGVRHAPAAGLAGAAIASAEPGELVLAAGGVLRAADWDAGAWDGAAVCVEAVDWETGAVVATVQRGRIAARGRQDGRLTATIEGAAARLKGAAVPGLSATCRGRLGDRHCRVDLSGRTRQAVVTLVAGERVGVSGAVDAVLAFGRLRVVGGAASGRRGDIVAAETGLVRLRMAIDGLAVGDRVELEEGCDGRLATCAGRFANAVNFRGEPFVPGGDVLRRTVGTSPS